MKINVVNYFDSWILGKFARELERNLRALGQDVRLSDRADASCDINHHIIYTGYDGSTNGVDTVMITHIDYITKARTVLKQMQGARMGVCMSRETMDRMAAIGVPSDKLCYVSPAYNEQLGLRKISIGIASRLYAFSLKREHLVPRLSRHIDPACFRFVIMGAGWTAIAERLVADGFEVVYHPDFDIDAYAGMMKTLDYYLYLGEDEGSMGFVDAAACGVRTIVTTQGFHLDAGASLTHGFRTFQDLKRIFLTLQEEFQARRAGVADWTWEMYARKHLHLWQFLLGRPLTGEADYPDGVHSIPDPESLRVSRASAWRSIAKANLRLGGWMIVAALRRLAVLCLPRSAKQALKRVVARRYPSLISSR